MSGSNALAAAKRRRVDGASKPMPPPAARPNNSQQRPQTQPQYQNRSSTTLASSGNQVVNSHYKDNSRTTDSQLNQNTYQNNIDHTNSEEKNNIFVIPPPPQGVKPLELLTVHHIYINRMATHFPNALDTLGENFNTMSANCDNLNDRLEIIERRANLFNANATSVPTTDVTQLNEDAMKKMQEQNVLISSLNKTVDELKSTLFHLQSHAIENDNAFKKLKDNVFDQNNKLILEIEELKDTIQQLQQSTNDAQGISDVVEDDEDDEDAEQLVIQEALSNVDNVTLEVSEN